MMYMHNTVSLEEELKKANAARTQLETYKKQVRKYFVKLIKLKEPNFSIPFDTFRMIKTLLIVSCELIMINFFYL